MKSYKDLEKKFTPEEIAENVVFPDTSNEKDRAATLEAFKKVRKELAEKQTPDDKLISKLFQLRFLIEDYVLSEDLEDDHLYFGYFLKEYISRLDKKNKEFAAEIDVDPTELSQIINKHRKPTDKIIYRLAIHSNNNFSAKLWFRILERDRAIELHNNREIIESERKHVKYQLGFSFKV